MDIEKYRLTPEEIRVIPFYKLIPDGALPYSIIDMAILKAIPLITHARDLEWMNRLLDAGIPVMDDPKDVPENLYTQAYLDHEKKATAQEIKRELELHFTSSLPTEGCFSDIGIYANRDKWHKFWKDMGCK